MATPLFQPASTWPVFGRYDVIVVGAGPGGICAAAAAGRLGARTLIVEKYGFPGGVATMACCPYLMGFGAHGQQIAGGIADDLVREMDRMGHARMIADPAHAPEDAPIGDRPLRANVIVTIEGLRVAANRLLERAGVERLYYTSCLGAVAENGAIRAIAVDGVEGPGLLHATTFVDASGDAQLVWRAGGATREAPVEDSMTKTILFRVGGVKNYYRPDMAKVFDQLVAEGNVPYPEQDRFMGMAMLNPGEAQINFTLTAGSALTSRALTRMDGELREQVLVTVEWFRAHIPGFEACFLVDTGVGVGVRAGRNIVGLETITMADVDTDTPVAEPVALGTRGYGGHSLKGFVAPWAKSHPGIRPIPWRALLSASFRNVAAAGRAISCEPRVLDTFRLMARCMTIGQAAGVSAALGAQAGGNLVDVGYPAVRDALLAQGAILAAPVERV